ncbi:1-acyl-sn-glycerol-3-phosphate acyltransferase [Nannocystaceae bacterium ST9]
MAQLEATMSQAAADPSAVTASELECNARGLEHLRTLVAERFGGDQVGHIETALIFQHRRRPKLPDFAAGIPDSGPVMLVSNHSGGLPTDGGMIVASLLFDHDPPRLCHGMVEKFAQNWPYLSPWFSRVGQLPGLPEHAKRLLQDGRVLLVFPEGVRGTGKLYRDRYQLLGAPYVPITPYGLPLPLPVHCEIHFGEPMRFEGTSNEPDDVIGGWVEQVRERIEELIADGRGSWSRNGAEVG